MGKIKSNQSTKNRQKTATKGPRITRGELELETRLPAPGNLVRRIRDEMDRLFEDLGVGSLTRSLPTTESLGLGMWAPEVEVFERQGELVVRADLPGLTKTTSSSTSLTPQSPLTVNEGKSTRKPKVITAASEATAASLVAYHFLTA